jgi:hypothetical protein
MAGVVQHKCLVDAVSRTRLARAFALNGIADADVGFVMSTASDAREVALELLGDLFSEDCVVELISMWQEAQKLNKLKVRVRNCASASSFSALPSSSTCTTSSFVLKSSALGSNAPAKLLAKTTVTCLSESPLPLKVCVKAPAASSGLSSKSALAAEWEKSLVKCRLFLKEIGPLSPRFCKLYGALGTRTPPPAHVQVQDDSFRCGSSSPPTISSYLKEVKNLQAWSNAFSFEFDRLGEFDIASFLKDQCSRGVSVPLNCFRALVWGEKVFDMVFHTAAPTVISQSNPTRCEAAAMAVAAKMATAKMLWAMEGLVTSAPTGPLRVYAGVMCALAHGVLRWRDLQRSDQVHLTADALVAVTWRMKKKKVQQPWAALRVGLSGTDWAGEWVACLESHNMPGSDFVVLSVSRDMTRFTSRIGSYSDGVNTLRALLVIDGMEPQLAMQFTLHSWRHLFPTAARQLRLPEHEQVEIGHWVTGSSMPRRYDSASCVTELIAKTAITDAFRSGWLLAEPGCVPAPPPSVSRVPVCVSSCAVPNKKRKHAVSVVSDAIVEPVKVVHFESGKVHIWYSGTRTVCSRWNCGSPTSPTEFAVFTEPYDATCTSDTLNCKICYGERLKFLRMAITTDEGNVSDSDEFEG